MLIALSSRPRFPRLTNAACACIHTHAHTCARAHTHTHTLARTRAHTRTHVHTRTHARTHARRLCRRACAMPSRSSRPWAARARLRRLPPSSSSSTSRQCFSTWGAYCGSRRGRQVVGRGASSSSSSMLKVVMAQGPLPWSLMSLTPQSPAT